MRKFRRGKWKIVAVGDFPVQEVEFENGALNPNAEQIASANETEVYRFSVGGNAYFFKTYVKLPIEKRMKDLIRGLWSERVFRIHRRLTAAGLDVPEVVCVARRGLRGIAITQEVPGTSFIKCYRKLDTDSRLRLMEMLGLNVGLLHKSGFVHGDLRWGNIHVQDDTDTWKVFFLDNERTMHLPSLPWAYRRKNLVQIYVSGIVDGTTDSEWDAFCNGYYSVVKVSISVRDKWTSIVVELAVKRDAERRKRLKRPAAPK